MIWRWLARVKNRRGGEFEQLLAGQFARPGFFEQRAGKSDQILDARAQELFARARRAACDHDRNCQAIAQIG